MNDPFDEIFSNLSDQQQIVSTISVNLQPVLHGRRESEQGEEYFRKLSFCLGYHIRKVEILRSIILSYFKHNVIKKGLDKNHITANVDGIISSETNMPELIETAHAFYGKTSFKSSDQRDASYLMTCMKLIIESCLLINFIEFVSNKKHGSFLSFSYDKLVELFNMNLEKQVGNALQNVVKSLS